MRLNIFLYVTNHSKFLCYELLVSYLLPIIFIISLVFFLLILILCGYMCCKYPHPICFLFVFSQCLWCFLLNRVLNLFLVRFISLFRQEQSCREGKILPLPAEGFFGWAWALHWLRQTNRRKAHKLVCFTWYRSPRKETKTRRKGETYRLLYWVDQKRKLWKSNETV